MTRRSRLLLAGLAALTAAGADTCARDPMAPTGAQGDGHLGARPGTPTQACYDPGTDTLDIGVDREPVFYLPSSWDGTTPLGLLVVYHGAGGSAANWQSPQNGADRLGSFAVLLMQSDGTTWDRVWGGWGRDVAATDRALEVVFDHCPFDPARIAFAGFSDGASYALSLGLSNAALVRHVIAFSPGFEASERQEPHARVFISHGTHDDVLPINQTVRPIVETLTAAGYDVTFTEFDGGHEVPPQISAAAYDWLW